VYNRTFNTGEVGLACAIGIIIAIVIFAFTAVINRVVEGRP
jgi:raffinose/stachyose/melibiose transport system permease protein